MRSKCHHSGPQATERKICLQVMSTCQEEKEIQSTAEQGPAGARWCAVLQTWEQQGLAHGNEVGGALRFPPAAPGCSHGKKLRAMGQVGGGAGEGAGGLGNIIISTCVLK